MGPGSARIRPLLGDGMPAQPFGTKPPPPSPLLIFEFIFVYVAYTMIGANHHNHTTIRPPQPATHTNHHDSTHSTTTPAYYHQPNIGAEGSSGHARLDVDKQHTQTRTGTDQRPKPLSGCW